VSSNQSRTNYGTSASLRADGSPARFALLKFPRPAGTITTLKLRVHRTSGSGTATINVRKALVESWTEAGVTYANRPGRSSTLTSFAARKGWNEVSLPVSTLNASGTTTIVLDRDGSREVTLASREGSYPAQLIVTTEAVATPTPTPTPTPSATPTPAPSATPTPTPTPSGCPAGSRVITGGSIATELGNTAAGGTLCLNGGSYSVSATIGVNKSVTILGVNSPRLTQTFTGNFFQVSAANVTIQGLTMTGLNGNRTGESCAGTGAIRVGAVTGVKIVSNTAETFTCGIQLNGTSSFTVTGNRLSRVKYAAITTYPATNGVISQNTVTDVNSDGPLGQNAYGIVISGNLSRNVTVSGNMVNRAPTWECYDTHDGQAIDFLNNTCIGPGRVGINHVNSGIADPSGRVEGNTIDAGGLTSQWNSIAFGGYGTVANNVIKGFGACMFWTPKISPTGNTCS
jgi:parallel beta-helix repeat protein